jgi:cell division septal protein FtsQ
MRARSAAEICPASSIVIRVTERSAEASVKNRRTTSLIPSSGVNVMKTLRPVAEIRVSPSE